MTARRAEVDRILAGLWRDALEIPDVDPSDNFLDLGGNSLMAMQLSVRLRDAFGVDVPLELWLGDATFDAISSAIAAAIEDATEELPGISARTSR